MAAIDIHNYERRFQRQIELLEESDLPESTKELIKEFIDSALHGWGPRKSQRRERQKLLTHLRYMAEVLHRKGYSFEYLLSNQKQSCRNFTRFLASHPRSS